MKVNPVRALIGLAVLVLIAIIAAPNLLDWIIPVPSGPVMPRKQEPPPRLQPPLAESTPTVAVPPAPLAQVGAVEKVEILATSPRTVEKSAAEPAPRGVNRADTGVPRSARGRYLVQVGAFEDATNAARLAARLARENYPFRRATETGPSPGGTGHEVVVAGATADEVNDRLHGTSLRAVATPAGILIQPPLPIQEAVALYQAFRADGFTVKARRAQGTTTLHTVRVGAYPSRSRAEAVRRELEEKGFTGFIVQDPAAGQ